jgi:hypothetical protein
LPLVRESSGGIKPVGALDEAQERLELARTLARVMHPRPERAGAQAMADRYALYCALSEDDGALASELRELVVRHMRRERPWSVRRDERRDRVGGDRSPSN